MTVGSVDVDCVRIADFVGFADVPEPMRAPIGGQEAVTTVATFNRLACFMSAVQPFGGYDRATPASSVERVSR